MKTRRRSPTEKPELGALMPDVVPDRDLNNSAEAIDSIKCVVVGDGAIGKTSLIVSYTVNGYPETYKPTVHDYYTVRITVADKPITFQLFDTAGQEQFQVIRRLSYSDANIFLICFNVVDPESFVNVREKWLPELRQYGPERVPIILVGLQSDQRNVVDVKCRLSKKGKRPIKYEEGEMLAKKIGAKKYVECSSLTQKHLKSVFDFAIITAIDDHAKRHRKPSSIRRSLRRLSTRRTLSKRNISRSLSEASTASSVVSKERQSQQRSSSSTASSSFGSHSFSLREWLCVG